MKKIIVLFVVVISSFCLIGSVSAQIIHRQKSKTEKQSTQQSSQKSTGLKTLFNNNLGNYPYEFKMFENKVVRIRLCKIMGEKQFKYLVKELSDVQTPIEYENFCYYTWTMKAHSGGEYSATICYNPKLDAIAVTTCINGDYKSYGEKGFYVPEDMLR
jgi:hypothetical protein